MDTEKTAPPRLAELMERMQQLTAEDLAVVDRVLMQLEINRAVAELDDLSDQLRAHGLMARLPEIIRQVRQNPPAPRP